MSQCASSHYILAARASPSMPGLHAQAQAQVDWNVFLNHGCRVWSHGEMLVEHVKVLRKPSIFPPPHPTPPSKPQKAHPKDRRWARLRSGPKNQQKQWQPQAKGGWPQQSSGSWQQPKQDGGWQGATWFSGLCGYCNKPGNKRADCEERKKHEAGNTGKGKGQGKDNGKGKGKGK